jgi:hypothetical protein
MSPATTFGRAIWCDACTAAGGGGGAGAKRQDGMVWAEGEGEVCNVAGGGGGPKSCSNRRFTIPIFHSYPPRCSRNGKVAETCRKCRNGQKKQAADDLLQFRILFECLSARGLQASCSRRHRVMCDADWEDGVWPVISVRGGCCKGGFRDCETKFLLK